MQVQLVCFPSIKRGNNEGLLCDAERNMRKNARIEYLMNDFRFVRATVRPPAQLSAFGWSGG